MRMVASARDTRREEHRLVPAVDDSRPASRCALNLRKVHDARQPRTDQPRLDGVRSARSRLHLHVWIAISLALLAVSMPAAARADSFSAGASMTAARYYHTATLLPDGQVLVAGGLDAANLPLATAERYDPITTRGHRRAQCPGRTSARPRRCCRTGGSSSRAACTLRPRSSTTRDELLVACGEHGHAARLSHGDARRRRQVLIAGETGSGLTASAELYDPYSDDWTPAPSMSTRATSTPPRGSQTGRSSSPAASTGR